MKYLVFIFLAIQVNLTNAQNQNIPEPMRSNAALQLAMTNVCEIDRDSRQCELFQILFNQQVDIANSKYPEIKPEATPEIRKNLIEVRKNRKYRLNSMESERKIKLSRMYKALDQAAENICGIKLESKPCESALAIFIFQTDVEIGNKLNPPAEIPLEVKQNVRKFISEEHPELNNSGRILVEASILWNIYEIPKQ